MPNTAILNGLKQYALPGYQHKYFVDGDVAIADAPHHLEDRAGAPRPRRAGHLRAGHHQPGGREVPLWEKNGADISKLGKNIGKPVIAQVANAEWRFWQWAEAAQVLLL